MNESDKYLQSTYRFAKTCQEVSKQCIADEQRLERLEQLELLLQLWIDDFDASKEAEKEISERYKEYYALGYRRAKLDLYAMMVHGKENAHLNKYIAIADECEKNAKQ